MCVCFVCIFGVNIRWFDFLYGRYIYRQLMLTDATRQSQPYETNNGLKMIGLTEVITGLLNGEQWEDVLSLVFNDLGDGPFD